MSKHDKFLIRLRAIPTPNTILWDELVSYMKHQGYEVKNGGGSRRKFYNPTTGAVASFHEPHPQPTIKEYVVRDVLDHLKLHKIIE